MYDVDPIVLCPTATVCSTTCYALCGTDSGYGAGELGAILFARRTQGANVLRRRHRTCLGPGSYSRLRVASTRMP
eukprot:2627126-Rhodomonas_salina.1